MTKKYEGKSVTTPCSGQAHSPDVDQDHCIICAPGWGSIYRCPEHDNRLASNGWCEDCNKYYER